MEPPAPAMGPACATGAAAAVGEATPSLAEAAGGATPQRSGLICTLRLMPLNWPPLSSTVCMMRSLPRTCAEGGAGTAVDDGACHVDVAATGKHVDDAPEEA